MRADHERCATTPCHTGLNSSFGIEGALTFTVNHLEWDKRKTTIYIWVRVNKLW